MLTSHSRGRGRVRHVGGGRHGAGRGDGAAAVGRGGRVLIANIYFANRGFREVYNCSLNIVRPDPSKPTQCSSVHPCTFVP